MGEQWQAEWQRYHLSALDWLYCTAKLVSGVLLIYATELGSTVCWGNVHLSKFTFSLNLSISFTLSVFLCLYLCLSLSIPFPLLYLRKKQFKHNCRLLEKPAILFSSWWYAVSLSNIHFTRRQLEINLYISHPLMQPQTLSWHLTLGVKKHTRKPNNGDKDDR